MEALRRRRRGIYFNVAAAILLLIDTHSRGYFVLMIFVCLRSSSFSTSPFAGGVPLWRKHRKTVSDSSHKRGKIQFERAPTPGAVTPPNGLASSTNATGAPVVIAAAAASSSAAAASAKGGRGHTRHKSQPYGAENSISGRGHRKSSSAEEASASSAIARRHHKVHDTQSPRPILPGQLENTANVNGNGGGKRVVVIAGAKPLATGAAPTTGAGIKGSDGEYRGLQPSKQGAFAVAVQQTLANSVCLEEIVSHEARVVLESPAGFKIQDTKDGGSSAAIFRIVFLLAFLAVVVSAITYWYREAYDPLHVM